MPLPNKRNLASRLPWYTNITKLVTNLADMPQSNSPTSHSTLSRSSEHSGKTSLTNNPSYASSFYRSIKDEFVEEPYLSLDWQCRSRTALTIIRTSAHNLNIERGWYARFENTLAIQRLCRPYRCTPDFAYLRELPFPDQNPII